LKIKLNNTCLPAGRFVDGEKTENRISQRAKTATYIIKAGILVISIFQPDPIYQNPKKVKFFELFFT